jgi:hypothetical protein
MGNGYSINGASDNDAIGPDITYVLLMRSTANEVCVVIPHYQEALARSEQASLDRCMAVLRSYPTVLVKPQGLAFRALLAAYPTLRAESFPDQSFASVYEYNRLMLSDDFYARFASYRYILIYQLDAFVFSDQLAAWCRRGYDYIGAPWLPPELPAESLKDRLAASLLRYLHRVVDESHFASGGAHYLQYQYRTGNGGFSLRRVARMRDVLRKLESRVQRYRESSHPTFNEDLFFSIEANRYWPVLKIPGWRRALQFSWELQPAMSQRYNHGVLPFGCHGWNKLHRDEWRAIFAGAGLSLDDIL